MPRRRARRSYRVPTPFTEAYEPASDFPDRKRNRPAELWTHAYTHTAHRPLSCRTGQSPRGRGRSHRPAFKDVDGERPSAIVSHLPAGTQRPPARPRTGAERGRQRARSVGPGAASAVLEEPKNADVRMPRVCVYAPLRWNWNGFPRARPRSAFASVSRCRATDMARAGGLEPWNEPSLRPAYHARG